MFGEAGSKLDTSSVSPFTSLVHATPKEDVDLIDYEPSPSWENMEVNTIFQSAHYQFISDDKRVAQFNFTPKNVFQNPKESEIS